MLFAAWHTVIEFRRYLNRLGHLFPDLSTAAVFSVAIQ
jgi:myosin-crossreactive antigen